MSKIMLILAAVVLACAGVLWLRHENSNLTRSLEKANRVASEQKTTIGMLKNQLSVARSVADKNERAQVDLRQKLDAAAGREAQREEAIKGLLNENEAFRRWYGAVLPDAVRRLHKRPACVSAGQCLQRLPESQPLPDAGK